MESGPNVHGKDPGPHLSLRSLLYDVYSSHRCEFILTLPMVLFPNAREECYGDKFMMPENLKRYDMGVGSDGVGPERLLPGK